VSNPGPLPKDDIKFSTLTSIASDLNVKIEKELEKYYGSKKKEEEVALKKDVKEEIH